MKKDENRTILIIEDEYKAYDILKKSLQKKGYKTSPDCDTNELFHSKFKKRLLEHVETSNLEKYVSNLLDNNHFSAIICDMKLGAHDNNSGEKIAQLIRQHLLGSLSIESSIPIFIMTQYSNVGKNAVKYGAIFFKKYFSDDLPKNEDQEEIFLESLKYRIAEFENDNRIKEVLKPSFIEYRDMMIKHNKSIYEKLNGVELLITGNHKETMKTLETLFLTSYQGLNDHQKEKFREDYETKIKDLIGEDNYNNINATKRDKFLNALKAFKNKGGVEKFVKTTIDLLEEAKIFDFTGGKLLSIGLKGIVEIACSFRL